MDCKIPLPNATQIIETDRSEIISITSVCRLCAGTDGRFIGIFSEEGINNDLQSKINSYLPIKVAINDNMPLNCCLNCASTILAWHELVLTTVEADRKFQNCHFINEKQIDGADEFEAVVEHEADTSSDNDRTEETLSQNDKTNRPERENPTKNSCQVCNKSFSSARALSSHVKSCGFSKSCDICSKSFKRLWDLQRHKKSCAEDPNEAFNEIANLRTKSCIKCATSYKNAAKLKQHVKDAHNVTHKRIRRKAAEIEAQFYCDICKKGYTRKFDMEKHRNKAHGAVIIENSETQLRRENLALIRKSKVQDSTGKYYYKCEFCVKTFSQSYNLMRHRTIHTGIRAYFCHICGKSFRIASGLSRHINNYHQGLRKFSCDVCLRKFAERATRDEHMNIHNNYRPFVCDKCGKGFKQRATLNIHKMFHTNQFKFLCSTCGKKFRRAGDLKVHTWLHTGHKPYKCSDCPAIFRLGQELKRHLKVHQNAGESFCIDCGSSFSHERYLKMHRKIHNKVQSAQNICNLTAK